MMKKQNERLEIRIDNETSRKIDKEAKQNKQTRSLTARKILIEYFNKK